MPFVLSTRSRTALNLEILAVAVMMAVSSSPHSACGTNSMEIVLDSANGIGSNSFVSAAGCQLLLLID